jgi:hypothetical protein
MKKEFLIQTLKEVAEKPKHTVKSEDLFSALSFIFNNIKLINVSKGTDGGGFICRTYEMADIAFKLFCLNDLIYQIAIYEKIGEGYICTFQK